MLVRGVQPLKCHGIAIDSRCGGPTKIEMVWICLKSASRTRRTMPTAAVARETTITMQCIQISCAAIGAGSVQQS